MRSRIWQLIFQERRRLLFVTTLAYFAGYLFYYRFGTEHGLPHVALLTAALYAGLIAPVALIICGLAPRLRFMLDAVAVSRLIVAIFVYSFPGAGDVVIGNPVLTAILVVSGGAVISPLMHGKIVRDRSKIRGTRYGLRNALARHPVRVSGRNWQRGFTGWIDDAEPIAA